MHRTVVGCVVVLALFGHGVLAHDAPVAGFGSRSPDAPPETAQFDFLVGERHCTTQNMRPDGTLQDGPSATWTGYYILGGFAIQDDWVRPGPDDTLFRGTNIRSFDPRTGKWDNRWLAAGSQQWKYYESEQVGDTMVMTGGAGVDAMDRAFLDRNTFHDTGAHGFSWRKDRSYDGGETWIEGVSVIHCRTHAHTEGLPPEARQFDFWLGGWDVNLRIRQDGAWTASSVRADAEIYSVLAGKAVLELWNADSIKGFSLRYFDTAQGTWRLWLNWPRKNRSGSSGLSGSFHHGRGDFYSTSPTPDGGTLTSRYSFNDITPTSLRWDDAYSEDGGETWRHQWRMEFTRTAGRVTLDPAGGDAHTYDAGTRCDEPAFRRFEALAGRHTGTFRVRDADGTWVETPAALTGYRVLDGCAVLAIARIEVRGQPLETFHHLTYNTHASMFEETMLDSRPDTPLTLFFAPPGDGELIFERRAAFDEAITPQRRIWAIGEDGVSIRIEVPGGEGGAWRPYAEASFER